MRKLILLVVLLMTGCANTSYYVSVGAGLKFQETNIDWVRHGKESSNVPISARIEIGAEREVPCVMMGVKCSVKTGASHHSQWLAGWPVNDKGEYSKSEFFVDYKWVF